MTIVNADATALRIDHLVIDVGENIDAAAEAYRKLGFYLTERGHHTLGSVNHLAVFNDHYLELLGLPSGAAKQRPEISSFPEGLNGLVYGADDAEQLHQELLARNVPALNPEPLARPVHLATGTVDAKFDVVRLAPGTSDFGRIYFCHHITPELVWRPEAQRHPNGTLALERISIVSQEPAKSATRLAHILGGSAEGSDVTGLWRIQSGAIAIDFVSKAGRESDRLLVWADARGRANYMALLTFRVDSLKLTSSVLAANSVDGVIANQDRILIPAHSAFNVGLEFVEG